MPLVRHREITIDGVSCFFREAGPADAPVVLLPHGYPCSSYAYRNLMPLLADRWRLLAPDFPGCGYSSTPEHFSYTFDGYADFLVRFVHQLGVDRFALYLHDFGSQIGFRLAMKDPANITAIIIQNGDIYEDQLGPAYQTLQQYFKHPGESERLTLANAISEEGFRHEFLNGISPDHVHCISPDLWTLHWALTTPQRKQIALGLITGLKENLSWFPAYHCYLREHQPPALIIWGCRDGYMPQGSALAYRRDLINPEIHLLDAGHWLLETHLEEAASLIRNFLGRT